MPRLSQPATSPRTCMSGSLRKNMAPSSSLSVSSVGLHEKYSDSQVEQEAVARRRFQLPARPGSPRPAALPRRRGTELKPDGDQAKSALMERRELTGSPTTDRQKNKISTDRALSGIRPHSAEDCARPTSCWSAIAGQCRQQRTARSLRRRRRAVLRLSIGRSQASAQEPRRG